MNRPVALLFAVLMLGSIASGQPSSYYVDDPTSDRVRVYMPGLDLHSGGFAAQITVDPTALRIHYDVTRFSLPAFSYSREQSFTSDFDQTASYVTTVHLQPTAITFYGLAGGHDLTPDEGVVLVAANHYAYAPNTTGVTFAGGVFRGTFEIEGPNGTSSGSFESPLTTLGYYGFAGRVETEDFPEALTFDSQYDFWVGFDGDLFAATVDGYSLATGITHLTLRAEIGPEPAVVFSPGELAAIPEPSTWAALAGSAALIGAAIRRRKFAGKH